jgi:hypothetical protein
MSGSAGERVAVERISDELSAVKNPISDGFELEQVG